MNKSAKNMEVIYKAKKIHDETCPWGGEGKRALMNPFDIERMEWEEGDVIAGLVLISDPSIQTMVIRVECDAEPSKEPEITEEVTKEDLVTV